MRLDQSVAAVVTGGASGLGEATVRALAARGAKVAVFDVSEEQGQAVAQEVGGVFCRADVTSDDGVRAAFAKARAAHGQERVLVNCAGTGNISKTVSRDRSTGEVREYPMVEFERMIQLNLIGTFRCITQSAAGMLALEPFGEDGERGVVVNTGSVAAIDGQAGQVAYSAGKGGIVGMTLPIARDLMNEGVRINTVLPGIFATPPMQRAPTALLERLSAQVPFPKRLGQPAEFAHLVMTMIENSYFNGEVVRLDGAIRMGPS
jgi:NAD(P)-dependent dehydrogenase (short-subunit alcohol dehydrogenase family)